VRSPSALLPLKDFLVATGSLLGLSVLRDIAVKDLLGSPTAILVGYARHQKLVQAWSQASRRQRALVAVAWLLSFAARTVTLLLHHGDEYVWSKPRFSEILAWVASIFSSTLFLMLLYCLLHVIAFLTMMVDAFCFHFVEQQQLQLEDSVREWNVLQAVLRRASGAVERGFLVLQTTTLMTISVGVAATVMNGIDSGLPNWLMLLQTLPLATTGARLFFKTAEVTEKCTRVPSLINSLSFGLELDPWRHYLVEYIMYSGAGFYVKEVRLTAAMAFKLTYASGIIAFAVLTKLASTA